MTANSDFTKIAVMKQIFKVYICSRYTLESGIEVGPTFILFVKFSRPYGLIKDYSSVPNRRAVRNKRAGGKILKKILNVQKE